ncbi:MULTISPECIES: universal stress protein [unclassified Halorubrum]|uniref:universal stress protein n=1 Tax=unclassified Halorubrum TaxID=2642239 RepID=UPI000B9925A1|nr:MULTISPECIES: universal stress protein [unclassified Halorubrum]OYR45430.1 universal stress protein UspA [Halorubrum sp. Hd13]OYR45650.1 universal stress protein UspA [Halorubrum sp. Ea8]OYR49598.1 universal stress protein UspA [Halorubrum sp. Eb13]OYR51101.1 universal stress protein UspA [Halorubrum sp. Ea1]
MYGSDADEASAEAPTVGDGVGEPVVEPAVREAAASTTTAAHARLKGKDRAARPDRVSSILVAVGAGPHTGATVDVAREIADATGSWLELFHVVPSDEALVDGDATPVGDREDADAAEYAAAGDRLLSSARDRLGDFDRVDRWLVEDRTAAGAIVEQSPYYDLVVVGAPTTGAVGRFVFGSTTDTVIDDAEVPVVVVEAQGDTSLDVA